MKLATTRQLTFALIISMITLKVLFLPSLLVKEIGRDCYIFLFIMLVVDFLVLLIFLYLFNRYPEMSFYEIMQKFFGTVIAKIIMILFCLFFLSKCWAVFQSNYVYLNENLHTTIKWYTFSIPLLVVIFYLSTFGVNAFLRLIEIMFPVIVGGFMLAFITGLFRADFSNVFPICENGFFSYMPKITQFTFWFGDYLVFIVFMGNTKQDKKLNLKVIVTVLAFIVLMSLFMLIVYSIFSYNTISHTNSISDIMQGTPSSSDIGSFDWIVIIIWDACLFIYLTLNVLCSFYCFRQVVPKLNQRILAGALLIIVLSSNLITHFDIIHSVEICKNYLMYSSAVLQYLLPILFLIFSLFNPNKKKDEQFQQQNFKITPPQKQQPIKQNVATPKNVGKKFTTEKEQKC